LLEEVYLLRSPANAKGLLATLHWSEEQLGSPSIPTDIDQFHAAMEAELAQGKASEKTQKPEVEVLRMVPEFSPQFREDLIK
jgi:hypothetical protein